jgi:hypothetical protein
MIHWIIPQHPVEIPPTLFTNRITRQPPPSRSIIISEAVIIPVQIIDERLGGEAVFADERAIDDVSKGIVVDGHDDGAGPVELLGGSKGVKRRI